MIENCTYDLNWGSISYPYFIKGLPLSIAKSFILEKSQKYFFENNGVLLLNGPVKANRCGEIRNAALRHLEKRIPPYELEAEYLGKKREEDPTIRRLRQVYNREEVFRLWMRGPLLREALKELLGDDPVLILAHHNSIMTKMPERSSETRWHRDLRYWNYSDDRLISVWLALGEETPDNGALEFIPGSHRMDLAPERFDEKLYFREDLEENRKLIDRKISFRLQAGDVVLFHAKTLHRANPNHSEEPKISFVYTVRAQGNLPIPGTPSAEFPEIVL